MILTVGCSFSASWEAFRGINVYSAQLAKLLDTDFYNMSISGQCNNRSYEQLHTVLLNARIGKFSPPKIIIWQLTDYFRQSVFRSSYSGKYKPCDLESQISVQGNAFNPSIFWQDYKFIIQNKNNAKKSGDDATARFFHSKGLGTFIYYEFLCSSEPEIYNDPRSMGLQPWKMPIGDVTLQYPFLKLGLYINTIQDLCDQMGIKLIIVNYYQAPNRKLLDDNIYKGINKDNFLLKDHFNTGMYNHLLWKGFSKLEDNFHFGADAHLYQAHALYNFITKGEQIDAETEIHKNMSGGFDYTIN